VCVCVRACIVCRRLFFLQKVGGSLSIKFEGIKHF
jgi:hypothetical protein